MSAVVLIITYFDQSGCMVGVGLHTRVPDYLENLDIRTKAQWFLKRGYGESRAVSVLLESQGQRYLISKLEQPLQDMKHNTLKEIEDGIQNEIIHWHERFGHGTVAGNQ